MDWLIAGWIDRSLIVQSIDLEWIWCWLISVICDCWWVVCLSVCCRRLKLIFRRTFLTNSAAKCPLLKTRQLDRGCDARRLSAATCRPSWALMLQVEAGGVIVATAARCDTVILSCRVWWFCSLWAAVSQLSST